MEELVVRTASYDVHVTHDVSMVTCGKYFGALPGYAHCPSRSGLFTWFMLLHCTEGPFLKKTPQLA